MIKFLIKNHLDNMISNFEKILKNYNFSLLNSQITLFEKFLTLFQEKNSQLNLSAIRDKDSIIEKHFIDSIILNKFIKLNWKVLDLWSGWGFPWIPLKITNSSIDFVLLDSTWKKVDAMNFFIDKLWLSWILAIKDRAEELSKKSEFKWQFDFIVCRSVAYMPKVLVWAIPFLKKDWVIILYKLYNKEEIDEWIEILKKYGRNIKRIEKYSIQDQERVLIFC